MKRAPELVLVLATAVWGSAFLITHNAVATVPPLMFVAIRFPTASVAVGVLTRPRMARLNWAEIRGAGAIGVAMVVGYGFQAAGMRSIDSGRAAFISALYVPIVPILQWVLLGRRPGAWTWLGVVLASAGLLLLAGPVGGQAFGGGDAQALGGSFAVAAEILLISRFAPGADARRLAVTECAFVAAVAFCLSLASGESLPALHRGWVASALGLGLASAYLQVTVNWALRTVPATRATLIFALEPVWAGLIGAVAGEQMGVFGVIGGAMIVGSIAISGRGARRDTC
jgi:drug/metabolite transporter (DMT)-like permease